MTPDEYLPDLDYLVKVGRGAFYMNMVFYPIFLAATLYILIKVRDKKKDRSTIVTLAFYELKMLIYFGMWILIYTNKEYYLSHFANPTTEDYILDEIFLILDTFNSQLINLSYYYFISELLIIREMLESSSG